MALVAVGMCFHVYAYVLNDVIDLPIDRTEPSRQRDPLVSGAVARSFALLLAMVQVPLALGLTMLLQARSSGYLVLAAGFALMGAYNLWGKRCPLPPLTDAIQGLAWGSLALYAPLALGTEPNTLTWLVVAYACVYILFINGIHGALRDLENDRARMARTTAVFFGARTLPDSRLHVPAAMAAYAWIVLSLLVGLNAALMSRASVEYGRIAWAVTAIIIAVFVLVSILLQPKVLHPEGPSSDLAWRLQMYLLMLCLPLDFAGRADGRAAIVMASLIALSLALFRTTGAVVRWGAVTLSSARSPGSANALDDSAAPSGRTGASRHASPR